jgi:hypothetical protein
MAKITQVTNGLLGSDARARINEAIETVEVDTTLTGDGNVGTPLSVANVAWGNLNGTLANQTDLQGELDGKGKVVNNQVVINSASDFPAAIADRIQLVASTDYVIGGLIDIGDDDFLLAPNVVFSGSPGSSIIQTTAAGTLFSGGDLETFTIQGTNFSCPDAEVFGIVDTMGPVTTVRVLDSRILSCRKIGTIQDAVGVVTAIVEIAECDDGLTLVGGNIIVSVSQTFIRSNSPTFVAVDLGTSVTPTLEITDLLCVAPAGAVGISGATDSANIAPNSVASVVSCEFIGGMDALAGITRDDFRFSFQGNSGIPDTNPDALLSLTSNAVETEITTPGVAVLAAGLWVTERSSHFTGTVGGRATHLGERSLAVPIDMVAGIRSVSGNVDASISIAVNGTVVIEGIPVSVSSSRPTLASAIWQHDFLLGGYVEMFVTNVDNTNNIIVESAIIRVR